MSKMYLIILNDYKNMLRLMTMPFSYSIPNSIITKLQKIHKI